MSAAVRWVVALACESIPIRETWALHAVKSATPYPMFCSDDGMHWLVVSGVGRIHAAAATMALHLVSGAPKHAVWINLGIAGHKHLAVGMARSIHKINDSATDRVFFPVDVIEPAFDGAVLNTVDSPAESLSGDAFYDMEGAAFFQVASRLSSAERVALLKVVSDHGARAGEFPAKAFVSQLISAHMPSIRGFIQRLESVSVEEYTRLEEPPLFHRLAQQFSLSATHRIQLRDLLRRHAAMNSVDEVASWADECASGRALIGRLRTSLEDKTVDWRVI